MRNILAFLRLVFIIPIVILLVSFVTSKVQAADPPPNPTLSITKADGTTLSADSDNPSYVSKGEILKITISNLAISQDPWKYRLRFVDTDGNQSKYEFIEIGNRQCKMTQANSDIWTNANCSLLTSFNIYSATITLNTKDAPDNVVSIRLEHGEDGKEIKKTEFIIVPPPSIELIPPDGKIIPGQALYLKLSNIASSTSYELSVRSKSGDDKYRTLKFKTGNIDNEGCIPISDQSSFIHGSPTDPSVNCETILGDTFNYYLKIDTTGFDCSPGDPDTHNTCMLYLTEGAQTWITTPIVVNTNGSFTLSLSSPGSTVNTIDQTRKPPTSYNFYSNNDIFITPNGCLTGNVTLKTYKDPICSDTQDTCTPRGDTPDSEDETTTVNGTAQWTKKFSATGITDYLLIASCQATGKEARTFARFYEDGQEFIFLPNEIIAGEPFDVELSGLKDHFSVRAATDYAACYFLQLKKLEDNKVKYINGNHDGGCNGAINDYIDEKYQSGDERYIVASSNWDPEHTVTLPPLDAGQYELRLYRVLKYGDSSPVQKSFHVCSLDDNNPNCINVNDRGNSQAPAAYTPCTVAFKYHRNGGYILDADGNRIIDSKKPGVYDSIPIGILSPTRQQIDDFMKDMDGCLEVNTAIGGINVDPARFVSSIMAFLLSISGGIALILIIVSGYQLVVSQGNPEKIQAAKDRLTSAIIGLLFIIFSLVIIQVIGVNILAIPSFGG